jgi:hypothetical protein
VSIITPGRYIIPADAATVDSYGQSEYVVATVDTARGRVVSITGSVYADRSVFDIGGEPHSCGQVVDNIMRAIPALKPFMALHLRGLDGEPVNGDAFGRWSDIPVPLRRYADIARDFDAYLKSLPVVIDPADASTEAWSHDFGSFRVSAEVSEPDTVPGYYPGAWVTAYTVTLTKPDGSEPVSFPATGSIRDYQEGRFDARGMALSVVRDIADIDPDDFTEYGIEGDAADRLTRAIDTYGDDVLAVRFTI